MTIFEHIIAFIAPHRCLGCNVEGSLLCKNCIQKLPAPPEECFICQMLPPELPGICKKCSKRTKLSAIYATTTYNDVAKQLVHKVKFERGSAGLADIALALRLPADSTDVVAAIPTANERVRQRGYDHARKIAVAYARRAKLPCRTLLARTNNERQAGATLAERHAHMRNAFRSTGVASKIPKKVMLIDDVITTGASLSSAAQVLYMAGAEHITAVVFAYTPPKQKKR